MKSGKARILLVSPMPPAMGGISVGSARLRDNLTADGYEVECLLQGLGELEAIQQIYVDHVRIAVNKQK